MEIKRTLRKIAELSVGLTAIATLILAGCGGGAGGSTPAGATPVSLTPVKGKFKGDCLFTIAQTTNPTVPLYSGIQTLLPSGSVNLSIPAGAKGPFIFSIAGAVSGVTNTCLYFNDDQANPQYLAMPTTASLHALVPTQNISANGNFAIGGLQEAAYQALLNATGGAINTVQDNDARITLAQVAAQTSLGLPIALGSFFAPPATLPDSGVPATDSVGMTLERISRQNTANPLLAVAANASQAAAVMQAANGQSGVAATLSSQAAATAAAFTPAAGALSFTSSVAATYASAVSNTSVAIAQTNTVLTTAIAQANSLITSLRTNITLLKNTGKTGFIDQQVSGVNAEWGGAGGHFQEFGDWKRAIYHGINSLQGASGVASGMMPTANMACATSGVSSSACQWFIMKWSQTSPGNWDWATHQMTITAAAAGTYNWSETIIAVGSTNLAQFPPPCNGLTLICNGTLAPPASAVAPAQTGAATVVGTNAASSVWTSATFSGNIQPSLLPSNGHNHTAVASSWSVTASGANTVDTGTGSIAKIDALGVTKASLSFNAGTTTTFVTATGAPVSAHVVGQFKGVNYQFDGTMDWNNFAQDLSTMTIWTVSGIPPMMTPTFVPSPQWYPASAVFSGSVTNLANPAAGRFMTGTWTVNIDRSRLNTNAMQQPRSPGVNYSGETSTFSGSITNGTVAPAMTYQITASSSQPWTTATTTNSLTYTDPANNTVVVNWTQTPPPPGLGPVGPGPTSPILGVTVGTISMGGISVNAGNVYSGVNKIGTITGTILYFADGTFISLQ